ncbi:hypothetical protein PEX1_043940 [Penicillium expansum]|uniref:Uncharacterized protein n=1 Tax=Penicillium expansum TaxID=27334 RepID=A0A0A2I1Q1_PENEN|nr:hypothetical protein PEX2_017700 [Penicillium expansum]KGO37087.1 hypothetical protein PEX1_043940 [Penicillium expansum]KGO46869.1 hypothetical protein PEXP_065590 [Penicillium expansum]KGO62363.1 hypothetical protein PEX2_017700 [Penicillium expansum]
MGSSYSTTSEDVNHIQHEASATIKGNQMHYPRHSADAVESFNILRQKLPSELVLDILEFAEYWVLSTVYREDSMEYNEADCRDRTPYLTSEPIQGERFPVQEVRINILSHDQGWSSYREDHGTFRNSWTWFDLGIERSPGRDDISTDEDLRLATNVHAGREAMNHQITYRRDQKLRWMQNLQAGDRISIVPRARFPGWRNTVEKASIEVYTSPVL